MADAGWMGHVSAITAPGVTTGSAYSAYDAVGGIFTAQLAAGNAGGFLHRIIMFDQATGNAWLRLHLFSTGFSASPDGATWTMRGADFPYYLGYADVLASDWVTGGTTANVAVVDLQPPLPLYAESGSRAIYGQLSNPGANTFGDKASGLVFNWGVMYD